MPVPPITLGAVNLMARDPTKLAAFWSSVTGATPSPAGVNAYLPSAGPGGFAMFFQPTTFARPEHQTSRLDLTVPWRTISCAWQSICQLAGRHPG